MTGNAAFKQLREKNGYSVREFAKLTGISPRMISYYESGDKALGSMPIFKCNSTFRLLNSSIPVFFNTYYPFRAEVEEEKKKWEIEHPAERNYKLVKKRIYARLAKIRERNTMELSQLDYLTEMYEIYFCKKNNGEESEEISENDYNKFVRPIIYNIKRFTCDSPANALVQILADAMMKSDYTLSDVAQICNVSRSHLNQCMCGKLKVEMMHTDTLLKICYLLDVDVDEILQLL